MNPPSENSHVIPARIRRFHEAKIANVPEVRIWGTGTARREFLYVDDMASAAIFLDARIYRQDTSLTQSHINAGYWTDLMISELANVGKRYWRGGGYRGKIAFDHSKLDGVPRKLLNSSILNLLGWAPKIELRKGLLIAYMHFRKQFSE